MASGPLLTALPAFAQQQGWTSEWDRALLEASLTRMRAQFDTKEEMLSVRLGPEYRYHSALRSQVAHPTRESLHYALLLLEHQTEADAALARRITARLLSLQEKDPASKWYGLWGWYLEEPAPRMQPADWNWADFLGSMLLLIHHRHGQRLGDGLRAAVEEGIRHASYSVMRRNVRMGYTNIAIKGTFVTLAAADLLGDATLRQYARERLLRLANEIDLTGSYNEYNSPTYNRVGIENLVRMRMLWKDADAIALARRMEARMWDHFSRRWHAPSRQLAGPMSRAYSTDIGRPLWLQKGLRNRVQFAGIEEIRSGSAGGDAEASYIDFHCPEEFHSRFLGAGEPRMVREIFLPPEPGMFPTQGSTWLDDTATIGSINQGDFWVQRRPAVAYWRRPGGGFGYAQLRLMKDDYDFSSALFFSVQHENTVLGVVNFRNPGGDKHISLDPIENGRFHATSLRLQLDITAEALPTPSFGESGAATKGSGALYLFPAGKDQVLHLSVLALRFGDEEMGTATCVAGDTNSTVNIELLRGPGKPATARTIDWATVREGFVVISLGLRHLGPEQSEALDLARDSGSMQAIKDVMPPAPWYRGGTASYFRQSGLVEASWDNGTSQLSLVAGGTVVAADEQQRRFDGGRIRNAPVPLLRLSEERLAEGYQP